MSINFTAPQTTELKPRIVVIGVGGAGGNAVNNMIRSGLEGAEFVVANTDAQALEQSQAERKIQLGASITEGLGCGARPEIGRAATEEAIEQIIDHMQGTHMAFITAGMGGGTGTGGAPVIAQACRENGILTVGVVTKPFHFEGGSRMRLAEQGIEELQSFVDTLIIIPNQNLFRVANEKTTFADAFSMADDVLHSGVRGITDLMVMPGLINLDFADVKTVMGEMGKAMMGTGEAEGEKRAIDAAEAAISNPLLDEVSMKGARGVLINITGGMDLTLYEVDEAANRIREEVDPAANIIVGSALDEMLNGSMRVSVVATGIDAEGAVQPRPIARPRLVAVAAQAAENMAPAAPEPTAAPVSVTQPQAPLAAEPAPVMSEPAAIMPEPASTPVMEEPRLQPQFQAQPQQRPLFGRAAVPQPKPLMPELNPLQPAYAEQLEVRNEPFIAPEPVQPQQPAATVQRTEPVAETTVVDTNLEEEPRRARGRSLFARMTGSTRSRVMETSVPVEAAVMEPAPMPVQTAAPTLSAPDPADRLIAAPSQEEDLLEIPSFLRRQAN